MRKVAPTTSRPRPITILANQPTGQDASGAPIPNWVQIAQAWALSWETVSGRTFFAVEAIKVDATDKITIRFMPGTPVLAGYRVQYGTRLLDVNAALNVDEQNQYLDLYLKEIPPLAN